MMIVIIVNEDNDENDEDDDNDPDYFHFRLISYFKKFEKLPVKSPGGHTSTQL